MKLSLETSKLLKEEWLPVVGYEGLYNISNYGRVLSLKRSNGMGTRKKDRFIKPKFNIYGYFSVSISNNDKRRTIYIHRLVAEAFLPNALNLRCVNHIDAVKINNHVSNLEWCTHRQNSEHAGRMGLVRNQHTGRKK